MQKINEQMALYQQIVDDGTLKAAHSGLVTYTKKLTDGRSAAAYENIVIVSDTDDLVLDIKDTAINEYKYSDYDKKYVIVDGEKYDVTESQYTSEVLVLSKINNRYPDVCVESRKSRFLRQDRCIRYILKRQKQIRHLSWEKIPSIRMAIPDMSM